MLSVYDNRLDDVQYNMNIYFFEPTLGEKKGLRNSFSHSFIIIYKHLPSSIDLTLRYHRISKNVLCLTMKISCSTITTSKRCTLQADKMGPKLYDFYAFAVKCRDISNE